MAVNGKKTVPKRLILIFGLIAISALAAPDRLDPWYRGFNHSYFRDELPADVVITHNLSDDTRIAQTEYSHGFYHIEFNPKYNRAQKVELETLLHEQCHILVAVEKAEEFDEHGQHWQTCMQDLARHGAFTNLW